MSKKTAIVLLVFFIVSFLFFAAIELILKQPTKIIILKSSLEALIVTVGTYFGIKLSK